MYDYSAQLQPGEHLMYTIQRSRGPASIALSLLVYVLWTGLVFFLTRLLSRLVVSSFILPGRIFDTADLIILNLFLGVLPFVVGFALLHQFISSFYIELALTDRRILGRVTGVWQLRALNIRLYEVEALYSWMGYLCVCHKGRRTLLGGFDDLRGFLQAFRSVAPTLRAPQRLATHSSTT